MLRPILLLLLAAATLTAQEPAPKSAEVKPAPKAKLKK